MTAHTVTDTRGRFARILAPRTRRGKIGLVAGVLLLAGALTAAAAYLFGARIDGKIERGSFAAEWNSEAEGASAPMQTTKVIRDGVTIYDESHSAMQYNGRYVLPDDLPLFVADEVLTGTGRVVIPRGVSESEGYITGIAAGGNIPAGWTITLESGCGATITRGSGPMVTFSATGPDATEALDFSAADIAVTAMPGEAPDSLTCEPISG